MLKDKVQDALNKQLNAELYSSYLYLSMAAWFEAENWKGAAQWMKVQVGEEREHGMKFYSYICDRQSRVTLAAIGAPKAQWGSMLEAFKDAWTHEQLITSKINALYKLAQEEADYATEQFLHWFIKEQVEEENAVAEIVARLEAVGESKNGLFMVDHGLGHRGK